MLVAKKKNMCIVLTEDKHSRNNRLTLPIARPFAGKWYLNYFPGMYLLVSVFFLQFTIIFFFFSSYMDASVF